MARTFARFGLTPGGFNVDAQSAHADGRIEGESLKLG